MSSLEEEDIHFIKRFVLNSGSLKQMAKDYEVTYPTVRLKLDRIIQKIHLAEKEDQDSFVLLVKKLAIDNKLDLQSAKQLTEAHQKALEEAAKID